MLSLYYKIWIDCIVRGRSQENNKKNWKVMSILFMTLAMSFNLIVFIISFRKICSKKRFLYN